MKSYRDNPDGPENTEATRQIQREVFAAKMQAKRDTLSLAAESADNQLKNGTVCPNDTDGDGDCGRPGCPICGS